MFRLTDKSDFINSALNEKEVRDLILLSIPVWDEPVLASDYAIELLNKLPTHIGYHWRVIPLLKRNAECMGIFYELDNSVQNMLIVETKKALVREMAKEKQLALIVEEFCKKDIPLILLKGTAFSKWLYSSDAPRLTNDIDILVMPQHWEEANQTLSEMMDYSKKPVPGPFDDLYEISYVPKKGRQGFAVDLHKELVHSFLFDVDMEDVFESKIPHPYFPNQNVFTLSIPYLFLHYFLHKFKDMGSLHYSDVDFLTLLRTEGLDLSGLNTIAERSKCNSMVNFFLKKIALQYGNSYSSWSVNIRKNIKPFTVAERLSNSLIRNTGNKYLNEKVRFFLLQVLLDRMTFKKAYFFLYYIVRKIAFSLNFNAVSNVTK